MDLRQERYGAGVVSRSKPIEVLGGALQARWRARVRLLAAGLSVVALTASTAATADARVTSAPGGLVSSASHITIGYSPINQSAQALIGIGKAMTGYAGSKGDKVLIADPNNSATTQVQQLTSWIDLGQIQAAFVIAINPAAMGPVIAAAKAKHVDLVITGKPTDYGVKGPGPGLTFSIIDYNAYGRMIGQAVGRCAKSRLGGKANVIYMVNPPGSTGNAATDAGLKAALASTSPGSKIVATTNNQNSRVVSQQAALTDIQANSKINAVAGVNDEGPLGALGAFQQAGKKPAASCIVDAGGNTEALADVKSGKMYASVALDFQGDLVQNVNEMIKMAAHPTAIGTQLYTPIKLVKA